MNNRTEKILMTLKEDKNFIELLIKNENNKIDKYQKSLGFHRSNLAEINDLIRKLDN